MKRSADWAHQWIFYLTTGFLFGAVLLRTLLVYGVGYNGRNNPELGPVLGLLAVWLALFASEAAISPKWPRYVPIYLALQTGLVVVLLALPGRRDYFAILFALLGMQAMQRLNPKPGALCVGLFTPQITHIRLVVEFCGCCKLIHPGTEVPNLNDWREMPNMITHYPSAPLAPRSASSDTSPSRRAYSAA